MEVKDTNKILHITKIMDNIIVIQASSNIRTMVIIRKVMDSTKLNIKISTQRMNLENSIKLIMGQLISILKDGNLMDNSREMKLVDLLNKYL